MTDLPLVVAILVHSAISSEVGSWGDRREAQHDHRAGVTYMAEIVPLVACALCALAISAAT